MSHQQDDTGSERIFVLRVLEAREDVSNADFEVWKQNVLDSLNLESHMATLATMTPFWFNKVSNAMNNASPVPSPPTEPPVGSNPGQAGCRWKILLPSWAATGTCRLKGRDGTVSLG